MSERVRLTKTVVDRAQPGTERFTVMDAEVSGFGLRVEPSGIKSYFIRYRAAGGGRNAPQRFMVIGQHGELTPDEARREARRRLGAVAKGEDPAGERTAKRRELTMSGLIDLYETEGCVVQRGIRQGQAMKPATKAFTLARLRHHVVPLLGSRRASEVTEADIERFARDVAGGKTARDEKPEAGRRVIVRGGEGAARKVVRDLSAVFSFAQRHRIVAQNPVEHAKVRKTDNRRERFLSLAEVQALGESLAALEAEGLNPKAADITRLWALTGARRNEIAGLRWSEVDLEVGLLRYGDSKTGRSIRPLSAAARLALARLSEARDGDSPYVFPATTGEGHFQGVKRVWPKILARAKLGSDVTPHVLRHSVGSLAASSGEALLLVGALLGHTNARSTGIYAHIADDPARRAADRVGAKIAAALAGKSHGEVVAMPKRSRRSSR